MKALIVTAFIPSRGGGGIERHVYDLALGLIKRGVDVTIACEDRQNFPGDYSAIRDRLLTVSLRPYGYGPLGALRGSPKLSALMDSSGFAVRMFRRSGALSKAFDPDDYDIIHTHAEHGFMTLARNRLRRNKKPTVTTLHGTIPGVFGRLRRFRLTSPLPLPDNAVGTIMDGGSARLTGACIAVSANVAREAQRFYGVDARKVHVIYNWTDKSAFYPRDRAEARRTLGLDPEARYLFFAGRADGIKGYKMLVEAMRYVDRGATLLVASKSAGKLGEEKSGNIRCLGYVEDALLPMYYSACDLFAFPSIYEGLPLTLIEAISCGAVPVCYGLPPMDEVVDGSNGYICDRFEPAAFAETVNRALADEGRAEKSRRCVEKSGQFDMDRSIDATLALYQSLLR